ncbi:MAG: hypothetical protein JSV98_07565 [candidate division WOR-3 bacterium]|nr:MAG: hypothetical protein JSV98_07565 [candidate division WOR-3 bacterium]
MIEPKDLSKDELYALLTDAAKNWLAHDGLWFQAVEQKCGMDTAIELDGKAWEKFTQIEATRIMRRLSIQTGGGIPALIQALKFRLYSFLNKQTVVESSDKHCIFRMESCRVQDARKRKNLPDFPCKSVGILEYTHFAKTIDPRIVTKCITCPPDPHPEEYYCCWEFRIK